MEIGQGVILMADITVSNGSVHERQGSVLTCPFEGNTYSRAASVPLSSRPEKEHAPNGY